MPLLSEWKTYCDARRHAVKLCVCVHRFSLGGESNDVKFLSKTESNFCRFTLDSKMIVVVSMHVCSHRFAIIMLMFHICDHCYVVPTAVKLFSTTLSSVKTVCYELDTAVLRICFSTVGCTVHEKVV